MAPNLGKNLKLQNSLLRYENFIRSSGSWTIRNFYCKRHRFFWKLDSGFYKIWGVFVIQSIINPTPRIRHCQLLIVKKFECTTLHVIYFQYKLMKCFTKSIYVPDLNCALFCDVGGLNLIPNLNWVPQCFDAFKEQLIFGVSCLEWRMFLHSCRSKSYVISDSSKFLTCASPQFANLTTICFSGGICQRLVNAADFLS